MSRRRTSTSTSLSALHPLGRRTSIPNPFSPSGSTSPLRIHDPTSPLILTGLEKAQLLEFAHIAASELVAFALQQTTAGASTQATAKRESDRQICRVKAGPLLGHASIEDYQRHVHPYAFNAFHSTSTLCAIHSGQDDDVVVTVKWSLASGGPWTHDRDFCYVEIQKPIVTQSGRRGYVRCLHSIPLFVSSSKQHHVRATLKHSGTVVIEGSDRRQLHRTIVLNVDHCGNMPKWVASVMVRRLLARAESQPFVDKNDLRMSHSMSWEDERSMSMRRRQSSSASSILANPRGSLSAVAKLCQVCTTKLKWYHPTVKCKVCHMLACKQCTTHCEALLKRSHRVCLRCNDHLASFLAKPDDEMLLLPVDEFPEGTCTYVDECEESMS
ncbi:hypothetical protein H310_06174 [Aphanomyces invadans]|uniref:START domain-containing protein n=1 Tax=Aphanomyces invadans TaxID=157072 RepID=A0A024U5M1_9STRA|nr:hypothetical protein H310_06174 [Aphanomyces invadans]ETW01510.1 hypothetical protein H310_06174 [Aphanomyces invadans]|eukprot:XP_008869358.1 hypothetical protein H310_06174 [Aphanomyces invadans]